MTTAATPPPQPSTPPPKADYSHVQHADAETAAHFQRLRSGGELYTTVQDAGDSWAADRKQRQEVSEQLEAGTIASNQPTTSQPAEPKKSADSTEDKPKAKAKLKPKR